MRVQCLGNERLSMPTPFDLDDDASYQRWRARKLAQRISAATELVVPVTDPCQLTDFEAHALASRCAAHNMAIYQSPVVAEDKNIPRRVAAQLGLRQLDENWLADDDGISRITVSSDSEQREEGGAAYIPYTNRPIKWHTDGYYHPPTRTIRSMLLHCVRPARQGGENALLDHELAYIALRDANPAWVRALMRDDAMTIPARMGEQGEARAAQAGPVFSILPHSGFLHMRYTARTRSIEWSPESEVRDAVAFLVAYLDGDDSPVIRVRLEAGMGLVCNNVLHDRAGFEDDPDTPRLLYRARYIDRIAVPPAATTLV